ncbi:hypothetical protein [Streptomyces syringium]|uniref:hypothetical protein n=1 Tax=Streptomyces syringium TaxID=76729 RepID=UPI0037D41FCD
MPAYLIRHRSGQRGDILVEGDDIALTFSGPWAVLSDAQGPTLAIPAEQAGEIQRLDPDSEPAPADEPGEE